jgi:sulfur relay (sulfurtransferase) DsrF/TusC family protein
MKKLIAGLFAALLLSGNLGHQAQAQNVKQYETLWGVYGIPQLNLNSLGGYFGQEFSASAGSWSLGYATPGTGGVPPATAGTAALTWSQAQPAVTMNAPLVFQPTLVGSASGGTTGVYTSTVIPNTSSYAVLISSGGNLIMAATPAISTTTAAGLPIANGTYIVLTSTTSTTITLQDNSNLSGSLLKLYNASNVVVSYQSSVSFIFNTIDGFWHQVAR